MTVKLEDGVDHHIADMHQKLPIKWCALESLEQRRFSSASDVWAFGVVVWEVFEYGIMPYPNILGAQIRRKLKEGVRLRRPENCPPHVYVTPPPPPSLPPSLPPHPPSLPPSLPPLPSFPSPLHPLFCRMRAQL
jgi:serine/threonine protein kinase